jgi:hypothetical protein
MYTIEVTLLSWCILLHKLHGTRLNHRWSNAGQPVLDVGQESNSREVGRMNMMGMMILCFKGNVISSKGNTPLSCLDKVNKLVLGTLI